MHITTRSLALACWRLTLTLCSPWLLAACGDDDDGGGEEAAAAATSP